MASLKVQVTFDSTDAHAQADFWAAALGGEVEDVQPLIERLVEQGVASDDDVAEHNGRKVWKGLAAVRHADAEVPRLLFQDVPEAKEVKNRVHIDLHVGPEAVPGEVARLEGLGARKLYDGRLGPQTWVTMADPEGNEFCVE